MLLVFISIPIMVLVVVLAVVPGIIAIWQESVEQRRAIQRAERPTAPPVEELPLAA